MFKLYETKKYEVRVKSFTRGEKFYNPLEQTWYEGTWENVATHVALMGTVGEMWFIPLEKFEKDYEFKGRLKILWQSATRKPGSRVCAKVVDEETIITTCTGHNLYPEIGDYLVCSANEDGTPNPKWGYWTINRQVFENTYEEVK